MRKFPKPKTISAPPLFIEEVARSAGGVLITIYKNSLPASPYSLYKQRESWITVTNAREATSNSPQATLNRGRAEIAFRFEKSFNLKSSN